MFDKKNKMKNEKLELVSETKQKVIDNHVAKEKLLLEKEVIELYNNIINKLLTSEKVSLELNNIRILEIIGKLLKDDGFRVQMYEYIYGGGVICISIEKEITDEILRNEEFYQSIKSAVKEMRPNK